MKSQQDSSWKTVSEIDPIYRTKVNSSNRSKITTSKSVYAILMDCWDPDKIEFIEQFKVLMLNQSNRVLDVYHVSSGGIAGTVVYIRLLFASALKANAVGIIISHNHPSGKTVPSEADKNITRKIKAAGELLDIKLLEHLIVTEEKYYSFLDEGVF